jgi:hypothetical protein
MITLPIVVMLFVTLSAGFGVALGQQRIQQTASDHARVLSFGGDPQGLVTDHADSLVGVSYLEDLVCVEYQHLVDQGIWRLLPLTLGASACALAPPPADE